MTDAVMERTTGAEKVVWDLSIFYSGTDDAAITRDMETLSARVEEFARQYRGKVAALDAEEMVDALVSLESLNDFLGRIGSFAYLMFSTNTTDPQRGALVQKYTEFSSQVGQKIVFFELEWNAAADAIAQKLLNDPTIAPYRHYLESLRRYKPHLLSEIEEKLLIEKNVTGRSAWTRFFTQLMGALRCEYDGEKLPMEQVLPKTHDANREVRRKAADSITGALRERSMELTYVFNVLAADKASDDRLRQYPTWISARNLDNKAPDEVVEALIKAVTSNYDLVARHYNLKRVLLGYDELTDYDRYAPLHFKSDSFYTWEEARGIVQDAFHAFSPRMAEVASRFFDEHWIHAPVSPGKRGGAFCSYTVPSAHPFVLMNYTGQARDVMTLAHELGHGLHAYLATEKQTLFNAYTPLTTAEMASVFGEMLVFSDLMSKEPDAEVRLGMLAEKIEDTFATVFRQVAMNRFEDAMHTARRSEGELTSERLSDLWIDTQRTMFKGSVNLRDDYRIWWSYIPHFLNTPGYVYAYAFGELLVLALFNLYKQRRAAFVPQYLEVLASGDSDYPDKVLAKAGIDLTDLNFWTQGIEAIRELVEQEEQLARQVFPEKF